MPDEVVVRAVDEGPRVHREGDDDETDTNHGREPRHGPHVRPAIRPGVRRATLCYAPIQFHARAGADPPVTGPARGGTERGTRPPQRSTGFPGAVGAIALVLALGLALRLIIAYVLLPGSGFGTDIISFQGWAGRLATEGPGTLYQSGFIDYTPGYMYVLWLIGSVAPWLGGIGDLIKLPPILADAAIGYLVWSMARELGARQSVALLAAPVLRPQPGQLVRQRRVGPGRLVRRRVPAARPARAVARPPGARRDLHDARGGHQAAARHPRAARRHHHDPPGAVAGRRGTATIRRRTRIEPRAGLLGRFLAWERETGRPIRILTTGLAGLITAVILAAPFNLSVVELTPQAPFVRSGLLEQVGRAAGGYPYVTVNAYNPWALVPGDSGLTLAHDGLWMCDTTGIGPNTSGGDRCSTGTAFIGPLPAVAVGSALLLASIVLIVVIAARHPDRRTLLVALAVLALVFFVVPTRVHERYLFPFYALAAILAAVSIRWRVAYVALSVATFLNMYVVLTTIYDNSRFRISDWLGIGASINDELWVAIIAIVHLLGLVWAFVQLRADGRERLADEIAEAGVDRPRTEEDAPARPGGGPGAHRVQRGVRRAASRPRSLSGRRGDRAGRSRAAAAVAGVEPERDPRRERAGPVVPRAVRPTARRARPERRACSASEAVASTSSTCGCSWCWSWPPSCCARSGSGSR